MTPGRGTDLVNTLAGEQMVAKVRKLFADVAPDFVDHIVDFGFGEIYARPGLQPAERQIAAVAVLTAIGDQWSLRNHIEIGLRVGMPPQQIVAVIMQTIPYAGFPKAAEALLLARQIFDEHAIPSLAGQSS